MAGAEEVLRLSSTIPDIRPIVLVLNDRGYERAVNAGARYIRLVVAVDRDDESEERECAAGSRRWLRICRFSSARASDDVELTGTIATSFGCPFEGAVDPERVMRLASQFVNAGAAEVDFADTVGMAVPPQIERMVARARTRISRHPNRHSCAQHPQHRTGQRLRSGAGRR